MKLVLGGLKDKAEELQAFLEPRVGVKPSASAGELEMEDSAIRKGVKPRHVKTYVKRFLHQKGLRKTFRVLVNGSQLTIQELEREEEEKKEEKKEKEKAAPKKKEEEAEEKGMEEMKKVEAPPAPEKKAVGEEKVEKKKGKAKAKAKSAPKVKKKSEKKKS